jgi:hypothetical protein
MTGTPPITVNVCDESVLVAKLVPALYTAVIVYVAPCVPPGNTYVALAAPPLTVAEVTEEPTCVPASDTVKVTVPVLIGPAVLVTVAVSVTFWLLELKLAEALDAVVVVPELLTVRTCVLSLLLLKPVPPL